MNLQPLRKQELLDMAQGLDPTNNALGNMSKEELISFIKENMDDETAVAVATPTEQEQSVNEVITEEVEIVIDKDHPEWTQYVLSLLHLTEIVNGRPSVDGLRRIFRKLEGRIVDSQARVIQAPNDAANQGRAVVEFAITYLPYENPEFPISITDAADCYWGNTAKPFCNHSTATAATMAEGRCLRKALGIRVLTNEEMQNPEGMDAESVEQRLQDENPAPETVKVAIMRLAERQNIDMGKLLSFLDEVKTKNISNISAMEGRFLMKKLNGYQQNTEPLPTEILVEKSNG